MAAVSAVLQPYRTCHNCSSCTFVMYCVLGNKVRTMTMRMIVATSRHVICAVT